MRTRFEGMVLTGWFGAGSGVVTGLLVGLRTGTDWIGRGLRVIETGHETVSFNS